MPDTLEKLETRFDAEWEEQAPMMGPPTYWCARRDWEEGHLTLSINFSPFKDRTDASFEINGSDFNFSGDIKMEGWAPLQAFERLLEYFKLHCRDRLKLHPDGA